MDSIEDVAEGSAFSFKYSDLPEIVMVELPFFASSTDSAYSTLGGEKKLKMMIRDGAKTLSLKFPSLNSLQCSIPGEKVSTGGGLLLRVRRKKVTDSSNPQQGSQQHATIIQVFGRVDNAYVFNQPADYQVHISY
jgi:Tau95 Triple barrel domain